MNLWVRAYESVYPGPQDDPFLSKYSPIFFFFFNRKGTGDRSSCFLISFNCLFSQREQKVGTRVGREGGEVTLVCVRFRQLLMPTGMLLVLPGCPAELTCWFRSLDLPLFQRNSSKNEGRRRKACNKSTGLLWFPPPLPLSHRNCLPRSTFWAHSRCWC